LPWQFLDEKEINYNSNMTTDNYKYKIAIISSVPFYYHVPLYHKLTNASEIDLTVYYCSDETLHGVDVKKMYQAHSQMVDSVYLLSGYKNKFIKNYSPFPSFMHWPFGLINFGIWGEIKRGDYDAVILQAWTNLTWWLAFLACLFYKTPVFFMTDSNVLSESFRSMWRKKLKKILLGKFLFKKATGFLTSGKTNEQFYKGYEVPKEKMVRLPFSWGYEELLKKAQKLGAKREDLRKSFDLEKNDFVLLYIGRLAKEKNPFILLEAFNLVNHPRAKLFFVGGGPLRSKVEKRIKELKLKEVYLIGFRSRETVFNFYTMADAFVLPSKSETWGIVVNEAMCFGLPIIASSQVGAAADLVKDGYNGFIFPAGDTKELATCIEKLIHLPSEERLLFGERSVEIIKEWINKIDPVQQILKAIKIAKNIKYD